MTGVNHSFRTDLSAVASGEPVSGWVARFELTDGRQVEIQVPRAVAGSVEAGEVAGFRIVVWRPGRTVAAELRASDLLRVFGARAAARALEAFAAGDLPRALRLAGRAGGAWRTLGPIFREVAAGRAFAGGRRERARGSEVPG